MSERRFTSLDIHLFEDRNGDACIRIMGGEKPIGPLKLLPVEALQLVTTIQTAVQRAQR